MSRYSIEFSSKTDEVIQKISEQENISKAEVIRRALGLFRHVYFDVLKNDKYLGVINRDNTIEEKIVLP